MRSYLVFTETGPILILTSCTCVTEAFLLDSLRRKGIEKFIDKKEYRPGLQTMKVT